MVHQQNGVKQNIHTELIGTPYPIIMERSFPI